jgi:hypothetical protein
VLLMMLKQSQGPPASRPMRVFTHSAKKPTQKRARSIAEARRWFDRRPTWTWRIGLAWWWPTNHDPDSNEVVEYKGFLENANW